MTSAKHAAGWYEPLREEGSCRDETWRYSRRAADRQWQLTRFPSRDARTPPQLAECESSLALFFPRSTPSSSSTPASKTIGL